MRVHERGPRGAQVPDRGGELVLPAGRGLAGALAVAGAPLFIFDAGDSAAALTDGLLGCPAHILVRLAAGSPFYADAVTWDGKNGRPARRGPAVHCLEPADFAADTGQGPKGRKKPLPPNPEPDQALTLPGTPLYGTVRAEAWHGVHPLIHGDRGWFAGRKHLPVLPGTLIHVTVEQLPDGRDPHRAMWPWPPARPPVPRRALARLPRQVRHRARLQIRERHPRPHRREGPHPRAGRPLGPDRHGRSRPAPARPPARRRPAPRLGEAPRGLIHSSHLGESSRRNLFGRAGKNLSTFPQVKVNVS